MECFPEVSFTVQVVILQFTALHLCNCNCPSFVKMKPIVSLLVPLLCLQPVMADYAREANDAIKIMQNKWYNTRTGLW